MPVPVTVDILWVECHHQAAGMLYAQMWGYNQRTHDETRNLLQSVTLRRKPTVRAPYVLPASVSKLPRIPHPPSGATGAIPTAK